MRTRKRLIREAFWFMPCFVFSALLGLSIHPPPYPLWRQSIDALTLGLVLGAFFYVLLWIPRLLVQGAIWIARNWNIITTPMKSSELVALSTFPSAADAQIAKGILDEVGIESMIRSDNAGGMYPTLAGADLLVRAEDLARANKALQRRNRQQN